MFERELRRFRSLVRERKYIITLHALEEMGEDDVFDEDIENAILNGQIVVVVLKMGSIGKVIVLTVYREDE